MHRALGEDVSRQAPHGPGAARLPSWRERSRSFPRVRGTRRAFLGDPVDDVGGDDLEPSAGAGHQRERGEAVESAGYALRALVEAAQGAWGEGRLVAAGGGELGGQVALRLAPGQCGQPDHQFPRGGGRGLAVLRGPEHLDDRQAGLGVGVEVDQPFQVEPVGGADEDLAVIDRQDDLEPLPSAEPDRVAERPPGGRAARAGRDTRMPSRWARPASSPAPSIGLDSGATRRDGLRTSASARASTRDLPSPAGRPDDRQPLPRPRSCGPAARRLPRARPAGTYGVVAAQEWVSCQLPVPFPQPRVQAPGPPDDVPTPIFLLFRIESVSSFRLCGGKAGG